MKRLADDFTAYAQSMLALTIWSRSMSTHWSHKKLRRLWALSR
ncbi:MAG: hypothetical protein ACO3DT_14215 [Gammaproteobacteria bacterium]